jgi:hypothetical protein
MEYKDYHFGQLFDGSWGRFNPDERDHAQHLLLDGGVSCDCVSRGVRAANGKFRFFPYSDLGEAVYVWPDDIISSSTTEPPEIEEWIRS